MPRGNGSYMGQTVSPNSNVAGGIWTVREAETYLRADKWPAQPTVPSAPTGSAGDGQVALTWTAPTGGSTPTDYIVQYSSNGGSSWTTFSDGVSTATSATVTGLTNGTGYIFRVKAVNALGEGPAGSASGTVTPIEVPIALLLHFDGSNGSTTFTDSSPNNLAVTAIGDGAIGTAQSKFGGASLDASVGGVSIAAPGETIFSGSDDFTLEFWVYSLGEGDQYARLIQSGDYPAVDGWDITADFSQSPAPVKFEHFYAGNIITGGLLPDTQWTHIALTRQSGTIRFFVAGALVGSYSNSLALRDGTLQIGSNSNAGENAAAWFDEVRIIKGAALYTANFTPPTAPFTP